MKKTLISIFIRKKKKLRENDKVEDLLPLLTLAVAEVQNYASTVNDEGEVEWGVPSCRAAVCQLVLVIEAALTYSKRNKPLSDSLVDKDASYESLSVMLMEMTTDIDACEKRNMEELEKRSNEEIDKIECKDEIDFSDQANIDDDDSNGTSDDQNYLIDETSTLRTLIAAGLHTGCVY